MSHPLKTYDFGSGEITEVSYLEKVFGIKRRTAMAYLKALHIQPIYIGADAYFSLPTLKRILFVLSRPGAPGFVMPGSKRKNDPRLHSSGKYLTEVTQEILDQAAAPVILAEMAGATGRDVDLLKKFIPSAEKKVSKEPDGK